MDRAFSENSIRNMAAEMGFQAAYCLPPIASDGAPADCRTLVLLLRAYTPGGTVADAFYPAKNAAYHQAQGMMGRLRAAGLCASYLPQVRVKPVCARIPAFTQGRNTLDYTAAFGSRFCMELIGCTDIIEQSIIKTDLIINLCAHCSACMDACPTGAIGKDGFARENCLRQHMLAGQPIPERFRALMGAPGGSKQVIGCDVCQSACPMNRAAHSNASLPVRAGVNARERANSDPVLPAPEEETLSLDALLLCQGDTLARFAALYGANYAIKNRVLAQAALAAGNTGDARYLPALEQLAGSQSPAVREHAAWAAQHIKNLHHYY